MKFNRWEWGLLGFCLFTALYVLSRAAASPYLP